MPRRKEYLVTDRIFHVYNKTIAKFNVFAYVSSCQRLLKLIKFYQSSETNISYSEFLMLQPDDQKSFLKKISKQATYLVELFAFAIMPNHFHFLLKQLKDNGAKDFISNTFNAFSKYVNLKYARQGPLFISRYKTVQILTDAQFKHVSRYIHLNPYSAGIVNQVGELENYPWSSYLEYIGNVKRKDRLCKTKPILQLFDNSKERYKKFVIDQADYQRNLNYLKHLERW